MLGCDALGAGGATQWGFSCCNPNKRSQHMPARLLKGVSRRHMEVEPPAAVEKAVDEAVFN